MLSVIGGLTFQFFLRFLVIKTIRTQHTLLDKYILLEVVSHISVLRPSHSRFGEDVCLTVGNGLHDRLVHLLLVIFFQKAMARPVPNQIGSSAVLLVSFDNQYDTYGVYMLAHTNTKYAIAKRFAKNVATALIPNKAVAVVS